jgi:signal peptidase I
MRMKLTSQDSPALAETEERPIVFLRLGSLFREVGETILIAGMLFLAVNLFTARIRVEGGSMEPSLHDGEFVVINRLAYRWNDPERGEIIVFRFPLDPERRFIKRIIGLPGDTIMVENGVVFVNDIPLEEPYVNAAPRYDGSWTVEEQHVFVLGDNRNNSSDSQNWGDLSIENIIGKAVVIYWPLRNLSVIPHYELAAAAEDQ